MDIEKAAAAIRRARMETKDAVMHDVLRVMEQLVHEVSIARSETALLQLRVEDLETKEGR